MMTREQLYFLHDMKGLDDIQLGMLRPSAKVKRWQHVRELCWRKGWIRVEHENHPSGDAVCYLTTKGLNAYERAISKLN